MNEIVNTCVTYVNGIGRSFCAFAGGMFIQSTVLIAILFIVDCLLRKRVKATFRYWIWMLVFIKLLLPPGLSSPASIGYWYHDWVAKSHTVSREVVSVPVERPAEPVQQESAGWAPAHAGSSGPVSAEPASAPVQLVLESPVAIPRVPLSGQGVLLLLWLVGVLVLGTLLIQRVCVVRGLIAQSVPAERPSLDLLRRCCDQMKIRHRVGLRLSPTTFSPAVCGLFRPVILLPSSLLQKLSHEDLRAVLIHELAHLKRGDLWLNSVQTLLQVVYFYNPLVWLANAMVRRVREQAVDEMVLVALGAEARSYSRTLVDIAEMAFFKTNWTLRLIGVAESKKSLEARIKHILTRPIPKSAKLGLSGVLAVLVAATLLLPMAKGAARRNPQTRPDPVKDTEILVVRWMAVLESNLDKDIRSIAKPVETPSNSYQCLACDVNDLIDVISKGARARQVIDMDKNLRWIRPSPEHLMSDAYSHTGNLKHPLYTGYGCGAAGPYKLDTAGHVAKLDLRYESVSCSLNPGPHVRGAIHFVGEVTPGKAVAFLGNLTQGDQAKASHLFVWQAIEAPSRLVPYLHAFYSAEDWIQKGPDDILALARNGLERNSQLPSPAIASGRWTRTFPDGAQARLVAVFSPKDNPFRFWNPDGQPISGIPGWNNSDVAGKTLAAVVERPEYKLPDPKAHETPASDGKYYTNYGWNEVTADRPPVFNFPHGYGTWQTVGQLRQGQPLEHEGLTYAIEEVSSQGDGKSLAVTHVKMWYGYDPNAGIRLVVVRKNGKEFPMEASEGAIGGSFERGFRSVYYEGALGLLEKDVDHFTLQKRPLAWAHFTGFAIEPKDAAAEIPSSRAPASEPNVAGAVWITWLPRSPIRSMEDYHQAIEMARVPSATDQKAVPFPACDLEIRRASDQSRVAKVSLPESMAPPSQLTPETMGRIGPLADGEYLAAFCVGDRRCSNVARLRLDSKYDPKKEPVLSLVPLPLAPGQKLLFLGIRATGPTPSDPDLTNWKVLCPRLVVDDIARWLPQPSVPWPVAPLDSGQQDVRILRLDICEPPVEPGRTHTVKAVIGKYESATVRIPTDDALGRRWDAATGVKLRRAFYGRVLFDEEDSPPAIVPGEATEIAMLAGEGSWTTLASLDKDGFFSLYLSDRDIRQIRSNQGRLGILLQGSNRGWFPLDDLASDPKSVRTITIRRPGPSYSSVSSTGAAGEGRPRGVLDVVVTAESDNRPLSDAQVNFISMESRESFVVPTDGTGKARIECMPGDYTMLNVSKDGFTSYGKNVLMTVREGQVNHIDVALAPAPKISGTVRDPSGQAVSGASVQLVPNSPATFPTDAQGRFEFASDPRSVQTFLVARHAGRNLAGSMLFRTGLGGDEETYAKDKYVEISAGPGLVLTGRAVDPNGKSIPDALVEAMISTGRGEIAIAATRVDPNGEYRINALPTGHRYWVRASRDGYGATLMQVDQEPIRQTSVRVETVALQKADQTISGVVVDTNGDAVVDAQVHSWGNGQPERWATTDGEGRFTIHNVCKGRLRIQATKGLMTNARDAEGGQRDIRFVLRASGIYPGATRPPVASGEPVSLAGKSLPSPDGTGIDLSADRFRGNAVLICFFDYEQRSSRNCLLQLNARAEELKTQGVVVVAVQTSPVSADILREWTRENKVSIEIARMPESGERVRLDWGVKSLPWLVLTDRAHVVKAEGFGVDELDAKVGGPTLSPESSEAKTAAALEHLRVLGSALKLYAADHNDVLPEQLSDLKGWIQDPMTLAWIVANVEYLGKGGNLPERRRPARMLAYWKSPATVTSGRAVLWWDGRVELVSEAELRRRR